MAMARARPDLVAAAFLGMAQGSASRQVVAAAIAALLRTTCEDVDERVDNKDEEAEEVNARIETIRPVLEQKVSAARDGKEPRICGAVRASRNVGEHAMLGCGAAQLKEALVKAQATQRGGKVLLLELRFKELAVRVAELEQLKCDGIDGKSFESVSTMTEVFGTDDSLNEKDLGDAERDNKKQQGQDADSDPLQEQDNNPWEKNETGNIFMCPCGYSAELQDGVCEGCGWAVSSGPWPGWHELHRRKGKPYWGSTSRKWR